MNRDALKQWCRLHDFLNTPSGDVAEESARLTDEGVDVQGTVARVKDMVRKAYQADLRAQAAADQEGSVWRAQVVKTKVAGMSLDAVKRMLQSYALGTGFGQPQAAAGAFFRDKSADECSEEDMRSLLADIMAAEEGNAEPEDTNEP